MGEEYVEKEETKFRQQAEMTIQKMYLNKQVAFEWVQMSLNFCLNFWR